MQTTEYKPFGEMEAPLPKKDLSEVAQPSRGFTESGGQNQSIERVVEGDSHEKKSIIQYLLEWSPIYRFMYPTQYVETSSWFKWYYIVPSLFVFFYVIMLAESILDSRRKDKKKEGMRELSSQGFTESAGDSDENHMPIKGILKKMDDMERHADVNRRVSFYTSEFERALSTESLNMYLVGAWSRIVHALLSSISIVYEWWALPFVYTVSRNAGLVR